MKLFTRYNRINLAATLVVFLLASIAFFFLLHYIFIEQVDDDLEIEQHEITVYAEKNGRLPEIIEMHDQHTVYEQVNEAAAMHKPVFATNRRYDAHEKEVIVLRNIQFTVNVKNGYWLVTVSKSMEGTESLLQSVIVITICTVLLMLLVSFFVNRLVLRKLWQPFYKTLETVQHFTIANGQELTLEKTGIAEFDAMHKTLERSVNKAAHDYRLLKEFTENASHELQTPLAVIRAKLDVLVQDEKLTEQQSIAAQEAYNALQRLSKLNQSLLLLAKIENRQFDNAATIDLQDKILPKLKQVAEIWHARHLDIETAMQHAVIDISPSLADILLNNLLSNAAKHNVDNGAINIILKQGLLQISNTGMQQPLDEIQLYTRFYKQQAANDNNGLGLSIIKQVCDVSGCTISYNFTKPGTHVFTLRW